MTLGVLQLLCDIAVNQEVRVPWWKAFSGCLFSLSISMRALQYCSGGEGRGDYDRRYVI